MILLAGVDRGGGGQHGEGGEFQNGELHDCNGFSAAVCVFYDDVYAAPTTLLIKRVLWEKIDFDACLLYVGIGHGSLKSNEH